jgi:hypothetical protein
MSGEVALVTLHFETIHVYLPTGVSISISSNLAKIEKLSEHVDMKTGKSFARLMGLMLFCLPDSTNTNQASENAMKNQKIISME